MIYTVASMIFTLTSEPTPRGQSVVPCMSHQKDRVKPQQINVVM